MDRQREISRVVYNTAMKLSEMQQLHDVQASAEHELELFEFRIQREQRQHDQK